ncbi:MAG: hypothetical protein ACJ0S4_03030 [Candidatus Rariloculaceae bacterium]
MSAISTAQNHNIKVVALTGHNGGNIAESLHTDDIELRVPTERTCRIQEAHLPIIHFLCDLIDTAILGVD